MAADCQRGWVCSCVTWLPFRRHAVLFLPGILNACKKSEAVLVDLLFFCTKKPQKTHEHNDNKEDVIYCFVFPPLFSLCELKVPVK